MHGQINLSHFLSSFAWENQCFERFSIKYPETKLDGCKVINDQSEQNKNRKPLKNQYSHVIGIKRGKRELKLFTFHLIGWEEGTSFLNQLRSEPKRNQSTQIYFHTQLKHFPFKFCMIILKKSNYQLAFLMKILVTWKTTISLMLQHAEVYTDGSNMARFSHQYYKVLSRESVSWFREVWINEQNLFKTVSVATKNKNFLVLINHKRQKMPPKDVSIS